ncbi:GntR family transcriptional regulator [Anaerotalea alkaliphila]|uniref:GntR family transcriptional regulator n=1 Tax=Anaerotalea alkaliphila TaxID=2662126 RepID=A0A7X5KKW8_9FIRM|nr:GntR family transcriptional regulator [Anaerotalea alkaliphila]NDL66211.1 GntR family transcriptional regulator [Anaerotalea alkaliphila]
MFSIDLRSRTPLYAQLVDSVKDAVLQGRLEPDSQLPSVRELAARLAINPNTIQKAFRQLEKEGYLYSVPGRGNFVASLHPRDLELEREKVVLELERVLDAAAKRGLPLETVLELARKTYDRKAGEE